MLLRSFLLLLLASHQIISVTARPGELRRSAGRAIDAVLRKGDRMDTMVISSLLHINRKYGLRLNLDRHRDRLLASPAEGRAPLLRLVDDKRIATENEVKLMRGIDRITGSAVYCDLYTLPWDFYTSLGDMADKGGYHATHALLAVTLLTEKQCKYDAARIASAKKRLQVVTELIARGPGKINDLRIEAVLVLLLSGADNRVSPTWIQEIVVAQSVNGSYLGSDHSTVLAAWVLLEYAGRLEKR